MSDPTTPQPDPLEGKIEWNYDNELERSLVSADAQARLSRSLDRKEGIEKLTYFCTSVIVSLGAILLALLLLGLIVKVIWGWF